MANYQRPHNSTLNHPGENNAAAQSASTSRLAQHVQGEMDHTPAYPPPTQTPVANVAHVANTVHEVTGEPPSCNAALHSRINFHPTHTCATCKAACRNNFALERHASKERHKAFLCTCTTGFGRLGSLNRHIAVQAGPKHHCDYCDDNKGFARSDKLIDHLKASHNFGEKVIAQFRIQARTEPKGKGPVSSAVVTTTINLPISTSAGYNAVPGGLIDQAGYSAGPSAGPASIVDGGLDGFSTSSAADVQPFVFDQDYPAEDLAGFDFNDIDLTGFDFSGVDWDMDMTGMNNTF